MIRTTRLMACHRFLEGIKYISQKKLPSKMN